MIIAGFDAADHVGPQVILNRAREFQDVISGGTITYNSTSTIIFVVGVISVVNPFTTGIEAQLVGGLKCSIQASNKSVSPILVAFVGRRAGVITIGLSTTPVMHIIKSKTGCQLLPRGVQ